MSESQDTSGLPAFMSTWYFLIASGIFGLAWFGPMIVAVARRPLSVATVIGMVLGGVVLLLAAVNLVTGLSKLVRRRH
jgi:hypothetical protein